LQKEKVTVAGKFCHKVQCPYFTCISVDASVKSQDDKKGDDGKKRDDREK